MERHSWTLSTFSSIAPSSSELSRNQEITPSTHSVSLVGNMPKTGISHFSKEVSFYLSELVSIIEVGHHQGLL